jgi:hypothetical protein
MCLVGLGTVSARPWKKRNGDLEVITRIQTPEFVPPLRLEQLRRVPALKAADFTKVGPSKVFYALTPVQARALMDLCILNSRRLSWPWLEMSRLSHTGKSTWRLYAGPSATVPTKPPKDDPNTREQVARRVRAGAQAFRKLMRQIYGDECAISGNGPLQVLDACHLDPHSKTGNNDPTNGLLLRTDLHNLLDEGLVRIHPAKRTICCAPLLRNTIYWRFHGRKVRSPQYGAPSIGALKARWDAPRVGWEEA